MNIYNQEEHVKLKYMKEKQFKKQTKTIFSPMPGKIVSVSIEKGHEVVEGSELLVVEAMKMQNSLRTPQTGVVKHVHVQPGSTVKSGQVLVEFE